MFDNVTVIGAGGRAGSAISARLRERGIELREAGGELVLLCVPDTAIADVAAVDRAGPVGGARQRDDSARRARSARAALQRPSAPDARQGPRPGAAGRCVRRRDGGDGRRRASARHGSRRRSASSRSRSATARERSTTRAPSSPPTTSSRSIAPRRSLFADAGAPPEALVPLMRRTIENGFELTGPHRARRLGDGECAPRRTARPASGAGARLPRARGGDGDMRVARTIAEARAFRAVTRRTLGLVPDDGRVPRGPRGALRRSPRRVRRRRRQPVREPGAVR